MEVLYFYSSYIYIYIYLILQSVVSTEVCAVWAFEAEMALGRGGGGGGGTVVKTENPLTEALEVQNFLPRG